MLKTLLTHSREANGLSGVAGVILIYNQTIYFESKSGRTLCFQITSRSGGVLDGRLNEALREAFGNLSGWGKKL